MRAAILTTQAERTMRYFMTLCVLSACVPAIQATEPFVDVTQEIGLEGLSGGVANWIDFNNDGWTDLYVSGQLWRNDAGKKFTRVEDIPLSGPGTWGDFDNDGFVDLFSWAGEGKLFRNLEGKGFADVSDRVPTLPTIVSLGGVWGDFNGDSFLDLYVAGYEVWPAKEFPDVIYLSDQGEKFVEDWKQSRILRARGVTTADFDEDGDLDIYVSNYRLQPNLLWRNNGKGKFEDVSGPFGTAGDGGLGAWGHTIGTAWGDLDNDGHLDLFVGNFSHPPAYQDRAKFLKNLGPDKAFHFEDKTGGAGLRWQESYASPALADFDNDGLLDLYFTTVYGGDKSVLYRNAGDWKFAEVTEPAKLNVPTTYQAAWGDFDNDGYVDLVTGGRVFKNPGGENHYVKVRLIGGGKSNRAAIGAQVRLQLGDKILTRQVAAGTGQGNQNELVLHFGIGGQTGKVALDIRWPDGTKQQAAADVDQLVTVEQAAAK